MTRLGAACGLGAMQSFADASLRSSGPLALERPKHCMLDSSALTPSCARLEEAATTAQLARP